MFEFATLFHHSTVFKEWRIQHQNILMLYPRINKKGRGFLWFNSAKLSGPDYHLRCIDAFLNNGFPHLIRCPICKVRAGAACRSANNNVYSNRSWWSNAEIFSHAARKSAVSDYLRQLAEQTNTKETNKFCNTVLTNYHFYRQTGVNVPCNDCGTEIGVFCNCHSRIEKANQLIDEYQVMERLVT